MPPLKKTSDIDGDNGPGRSRGGFGTKIHLATDGSGLPLNIVLSPGQAHESPFAQRLLDGIGVQRQNGSMKRRGHAVLADKAYSGRALRNELKNNGIKAVIPRKSNEKMASDGRAQLDRDAYRNRNVVERCFGRLKEYRRIATRYDKTARNYLAMVKLGCIRLFINAYVIKGHSLVSRIPGRFNQSAELLRLLRQKNHLREASRHSGEVCFLRGGFTFTGFS